MRKATYSLKKVICPNAHCIGSSSNVAKPGYWVSYSEGPGKPQYLGRVLGRIDETDSPDYCVGYIAVIRLILDGKAAGIAWMNPRDVSACYERPPTALFSWLTGADWVKNKNDIARIVAMSEHGTLSDQFIESRHDPEKRYNASPAYIAQFIL